MRTFRILAAGWAIGAAVIVALSIGAESREQKNARREAAAAEKAAQDAPAAGALVHRSSLENDLHLLRVPVLGVAPEDLLDTFTQVRGGGRIHHAIDILAPRGTPVIAVVDGTIRKLFNSRAGGLTVYHFDVKEERLYYYAHLDRYADGLREGASIKAGTVIGYVGTTGNAAPDTPHLHFSVEVLPPTKEWWKGVAVNPYPLLTTRASVLR